MPNRLSGKNKLRENEKVGKDSMVGKKSKLKKIGISALVGVTTFTCLGVWGVYNSHNNLYKEAQAQTLKTTDTRKEMIKLYSKDTNLLTKEKSLKDIEKENQQLKEKIKQLKNSNINTPIIDFNNNAEDTMKELKNNIEDLEKISSELDYIISVYNHVNNLFEQEVFIQEDLGKLVINKELEIKDVEQTEKLINKSKNGKLKQISTKYTIEAKKQIKTIQQAKEIEKKLVNNDKVISLDENNLKEAMKLSDSIQNEQVKKDIQAQLNKVSSEIEKKKEQERVEQEKEQQRIEQENIKAQEQAQKQQATNNSSSQNKSTPVADAQTSKPFTGTSIGGHNTVVQTTSATEGYGDADILYLWTGLPNWYLAERISPVGAAARSLRIGSNVTINGQSFTVTQIDYGVRNGSEDVPMVIQKHQNLGGIVIQTCETDDEWSTLTIIYAQ